MTDELTPPAGDRIEQVDLQLEMQRSYLDYAMSVIVGRALPDVRDGLKPVHRRVIYAMYDGGYRPDRAFSKSARVVGEVMGQFHPHGDTSIYDTLVRLIQPWSLRYPLALGQGNFGSPGNDGAAAPRYTETKMAPLALEMSARHHRGDRRLPGQLRRPHPRARRAARPLPEPPGERVGRYRGRHGHQHPAAQPPRGGGRRHLVPREPRGIARGTARRAARAHQGARLPDGRTDPGRQGHSGCLSHPVVAPSPCVPW